MPVPKPRRVQVESPANSAKPEAVKRASAEVGMVAQRRCAEHPEILLESDAGRFSQLFCASVYQLIIIVREATRSDG